jgi:hypothetical protein
VARVSKDKECGLNAHSFLWEKIPPSLTQSVRIFIVYTQMVKLHKGKALLQGHNVCSGGTIVIFNSWLQHLPGPCSSDNQIPLVGAAFPPSQEADLRASESGEGPLLDLRPGSALVRGYLRGTCKNIPPRSGGPVRADHQAKVRRGARLGVPPTIYRPKFARETMMNHDPILLLQRQR